MCERVCVCLSLPQLRPEVNVISKLFMYKETYKRDLITAGLKKGPISSSEVHLPPRSEVPGKCQQRPTKETQEHEKRSTDARPQKKTNFLESPQKMLNRPRKQTCATLQKRPTFKKEIDLLETSERDLQKKPN